MKKINQDKFNELIEQHWINTLEWQDKILKELKKMMLESALEWELWYELWYNKWTRRKEEIENKNYRNWYSTKQVLTSDWPIEISVPRDRNWAPQAYSSLNLNQKYYQKDQMIYQTGNKE